MRAQLKRTVLDMIMFHDAQALIYHILYHYVTARCSLYSSAVKLLSFLVGLGGVLEIEKSPGTPHRGVISFPFWLLPFLCNGPLL
jgi:hypothetical protein